MCYPPFLILQNNACLTDDGITIELSLMRGVYVDAEKRIAVAEGAHLRHQDCTISWLCHFFMKGIC